MKKSRFTEEQIIGSPVKNADLIEGQGFFGVLK